MGFFGSDTPKIFKNKEEIRSALMHIQSLDSRQRPLVMGSLIRELDNGGVTLKELKEVIHELRKNQVITQTDAENLLHLADGSGARE